MSAKVIHEDERFRITKLSSGGRMAPRSVKIEALKHIGPGWSRKMQITIDELFDLTEALDDICDQIEDNEALAE